MRTYGVICGATGFIAYIGHATSPEDACYRATKDTPAWGSLGPFTRTISGAPKDDDQDWLELSVHDVTGVLEPTPSMGIDDEAAMSAMSDDTYVAQFIARQY